jgi:hypothetical protein
LDRSALLIWWALGVGWFLAAAWLHPWLVGGSVLLVLLTYWSVGDEEG